MPNTPQSRGVPSAGRSQCVFCLGSVLLQMRFLQCNPTVSLRASAFPSGILRVNGRSLEGNADATRMLVDYTCVQRPCATRTSWKSPVLWEVGVNKGGPQVCWEEWETLDSAPCNSHAVLSPSWDISPGSGFTRKSLSQ